VDHHIIYRRNSLLMSFRRTGKLLTLVGFVICLSLLGILYGNLSTITEERDHILVKKNEIKQEVGELNNRISSLNEKVIRLESSLNQCNAAKLEAEEGRSLLQQEVDSLKSDVEQRKVNEASLKTQSEQEIQQLKDQLRDSQLEVSGHDEAAETCKNRNEDLLAQLNAGNERVSQLERSNQECESEKRRLIQEAQESNKGAVQAQKNDTAEEGSGNVNPVAAVPAPAAENEHKEAPADLVDHVADIPEAPQDNAVVDANQVIPNAQAPAPGAQAEQPAAPAEDSGAVAPAPAQDFKRDADEPMPEGMGGFQPLQPIPEGALVESLDKVRQEEQLEQLQERQDQIQPQDDTPKDDPEPVKDELPDPNLQPALPPEIQPAQPAPHENDDAAAMENNNVVPDNQSEDDNKESDNNQQNAIDHEVQFGVLPDVAPAQPVQDI